MIRKLGYAYDVEIYKNFFSVIFIPISANQDIIDKYIDADIRKDKEAKRKYLTKLDAKVFVFMDDENPAELDRLIIFIRDKVKSLYSYNGLHYDDVVLKFIYNNIRYNEITNMSLYLLSQCIISGDREYKGLEDFRKPYYKLPIPTIDLKSLNHLQVSLKHVAVVIKWYRIQDLPIDFHKEINYDEIPLMLDYNVNDVLITRALFYESKDEFQSRLDIKNKYNTDLNILSKARSSAASVILEKYYESGTGIDKALFTTDKTERRLIRFDSIIEDLVQFTDPILVKFLERLKRKTIKVGFDKFKEALIYGGKEYTFAKGGLHSVDRPGRFKSTDNYDILDADVSSYYPSLMLLFSIAPKHLNSEVFLNIVKVLTESRLKAKKAKDKVNAGIYKIVINAIYGKLGYIKDWLLDLKAMYHTTINGQLLLIVLIEKYVDAEIEVISANTDGVTCKVFKNQREDYDRINLWWQQYTTLDLEVNRYSIYARTSVNDYIAEIDNLDGKPEIKYKGDFVEKLALSKGYNKPIVAKAVNANILFGTPVREYIMNHTDIYDFMIAQKTGNQFTNEYHHIVNGELEVVKVQKSIRYYVANSGVTLLKRKTPDAVQEERAKNIIEGKPNKKITILYQMLKGKRCKIINDYYYVKDFKEYDVNYNYYIGEANALLDAINGKLTKNMKKEAGNMFDELTLF